MVLLLEAPTCRQLVQTRLRGQGARHRYDCCAFASTSGCWEASKSTRRPLWQTCVRPSWTMRLEACQRTTYFFLEVRQSPGVKKAVDVLWKFFPFLTIMAEDARILPPAGEPGGLAPAPANDGPSNAVARENLQTPVNGQRQTIIAPSGDSPRDRIEDAATLEEEMEIGRSAVVAVGSGASLELQITDGPLEGMTVTVDGEGARIGRHTSNTLVIPEAGISRFHYEIHYIDGEFCVKDLGSTTGTYFYLRPHGHFQMFPGLMVKLGETEMQVLPPDPRAQEPELSILFYEGPLVGQKVIVPSTGMTIGRVHDNNLVLLQDGTVSAHHAMIFCEGGEFYIADLGSCNGTCVRLSSERTDSDWHPIMDGDVLGAGCTKVRCRVHLP